MTMKKLLALLLFVTPAAAQDPVWPSVGTSFVPQYRVQTLSVTSTTGIFASITMDGEVYINWERLEAFLAEPVEVQRRQPQIMAIARALDAVRKATWSPLP